MDEEEDSNRQVDPGWTEISASLRSNQLYVKLPPLKIKLLVIALKGIGSRLVGTVPDEDLKATRAMVAFLNGQARHP